MKGECGKGQEGLTVLALAIWFKDPNPGPSPTCDGGWGPLDDVGTSGLSILVLRPSKRLLRFLITQRSFVRRFNMATDPCECHQAQQNRKRQQQASFLTSESSPPIYVISANEML